MPIRASERARYPKDWKAISAAIRLRSGGRCECPGGVTGCGLHRGRRCIEENGKPATYAKGKVVLTVAHLDHQPERCEPSNLRALCQRCHLRYDAEHHQKNARATREAKKVAAGQMKIEAPRG